MASKRKPTDSLSGRSSKRAASSASKPSTPASLVSSDEYTDGEEDTGHGSGPDSDSDPDYIKSAIDNFTLSSARRKTKQRPQQADSASSLFSTRDFSYLVLKSDHENRPLWIDPEKGRIIFESFSPIAKQAQDFLITIAEPLSRPQFIHEYAISVHSLYAAVSVGLGAQEIITTLDRFSKTALPEEMKMFIQTSTQAFGKVKLVLKHNQYFVESSDADVLQRLLKDDVIGPCRVAGTEEVTREAAPSMAGLVIPGTSNATGIPRVTQLVEAPRQSEFDEDVNDDDMFAAARTEEEDEDDEVEQVHAFQVSKDTVETVQKRCLELQLPITEEYDFRRDEINPNLEIDLKPQAKIRDYQEKSLAKMFGNGRAKSGIIVLPCGAGKTLVGITAACTVKKGVIIMCTSSMSVIQWRNEFLKWSNINPKDIAVFTSDHKDKFAGATGIIISTYSMVTQNRGRSYDSGKMMDFLTSREWGLMILDEVHVVPASIFRKVTSSIASHSKLGLTATLLREDDKIKDLNFLIGPKLYEANWMELAEQGHIARVQCAEVWCPMSPEFMNEHVKASSRKQMLLYIMNPTKFQTCQFLIDYHENRGDKVIVFSDNVFALEKYAKRLGKAYIYGGTPQAERLRILENFQHNEAVNTIFLSKIGDTSLDLPEATCLIQISSHYGSRRQEAQRLGRILRAKRRNDEGFNAFFYSLVSTHTDEMKYSAKRQAFLVDQGYAFKVITHLQGMEKMKDLAFNTAQERRELLSDVLLQHETAADTEKIDDDLFSSRGHYGTSHHKKPGARRVAGQLSELSGGQDMAYVEYNKSRNKELKSKGPHNAFMKKLKRDTDRRRAAQ